MKKYSAVDIWASVEYGSGDAKDLHFVEAPDPDLLKEVLDDIEKGHDLVSDLCTGKKKFTMSVPVDEEHDTDCVLSGALEKARKLLVGEK